TQSASQSAHVVQAAFATAPDAALAQNVADGMQFVVQLQQTCTVACSGATASASTAQASDVTQVAQVGAGGVSAQAGGFPTGPGAAASSAQLGPGAFFAWVAALASELAATVQTTVQVQVAACLSHCTGGVQTQIAGQTAAVEQVSVAT